MMLLPFDGHIVDLLVLLATDSTMNGELLGVYALLALFFVPMYQPPMRSVIASLDIRVRAYLVTFLEIPNAIEAYYL